MPIHPLARPVAFLLLAPLLALAACSVSRQGSPAVDDLSTAQPVAPTNASTAAPVSGPTSVKPTDASSPTCPATREGQVDPAAILELGPGPGIPPSSAKGEMLVIVGAVYTADCTPLAGATLNVWQTDANGEYGPGHSSGDLRCCYLMGSLRTDDNGRYQLITVKPANYKGEQFPPPAHIHVEISHSSMATLQTEIVFAGDPFLPEILPGYVVVNLETIPATAETATYLRGVADITLE